jgi:hypothetical protein
MSPEFPTETGNIVLSDDILITGQGNIYLDASQGMIVNDASSTSWLTDGDNIHQGIDWAIKNSMFTVDVETGQIKLDKVSD